MITLIAVLLTVAVVALVVLPWRGPSPVGGSTVAEAGEEIETAIEETLRRGYCPHCGAAREARHLAFCPHCGQALEEVGS
ncbi:MAG: hypothetical protein K6U14_08950 [Firmicutes bacterium]|nr:hypothetical protein [Alicyclobacillaceae bacterium]MCL6497738.1 hypothetical protein [Bacillota bacterium]